MAHPSVPSNRTYDVAVIGGGVIGLACAWRAAQSGASVVLLERDVVGCGASRVAAGMLAPVAEADAGESALLELGVRSAAAWPAFAGELRAVTGVDVGLRTSGTLVVARDRDEAEALEREAEIRERLGLVVERLLGSEARRLEPALAPGVRAALRCAADHSVDPRALLRALELAARESTSVEVVERCAVEAIEGGAVRLAGGARVLAGRVVLCAGAWSAELCELPVRPVKGQTLRLRARDGEPPLLTRTVRYEGGYLVPRADGRVVLGATQEERGFDVAMTAGGIYELLRDASEVVPGVLELEVEELVAGLRPGTPDNVPIVRELDDGVIAATGHYRNGILLAPLTARLVSEMLEPIPAVSA